MSDNIQLNFINKSSDTNNSSIVIFQQNVATDYSELAVAWKVIKNCGLGDNHPFRYPMHFQISAADSWGNHTPQLDARYGEHWALEQKQSGNQLTLKGEGINPDEVVVSNSMPIGAMDANVYKDGKLLARKTSLAPQQKAVFAFEDKIRIGVVSEIEEGDVMNKDMLAAADTELSLEGVGKADIVMRGGGPGKDSEPFTFTLENIEQA